MLELADSTFEGRVQYCVWVQFPLFAPILFRRNIMKEEFLLLLQSVQREGIDKLLAYIEKQTFLKHLLVQDFMVIMKVGY